MFLILRKLIIPVLPFLPALILSQNAFAFQTINHSEPTRTSVLIRIHGNCHYWRHACYDTDGIFESSYNHCLRRKGCYDHPHRPKFFSHTTPLRNCHKWQKRCTYRWGYGNDNYYGCLRFHGCSLMGKYE